MSNTHLLQRIISLSQESVTSIREIIWAIDPKPETLYDLLLRVHDLAINACRGYNMILKFDIPKKESIPDKNLLPEQRKHLWLIFKEAIHNAVKHSNGSKLTIEVLYKIRLLHFYISDNGCGLDSTGDQFPFSGKGINIMKSRIEQLGGSFEISSGADKGTTLRFWVRI